MNTQALLTNLTSEQEEVLSGFGGYDTNYASLSVQIDHAATMDRINQRFRAFRFPFRMPWRRW